MKKKLNKNNNNYLNIQESNTGESNPEFQESKVTGDHTKIQNKTAADDNTKIQSKTAADDNTKIQNKTVVESNPEFQEVAESSPEIQDSSVTEDSPAVQDSKVSEEISEVTDVTVSEETPKPKAKFFGLFRKSKSGIAAEGVPEVQETIAAESVPETPADIISEDVSEVTDVTVSEETPEPKAKFFGLFRKSKGGKAAEGVPEVQETIAAESIPEVQESIISEDISEVSDVTVSEETPKPKATFFGLFRKSKSGKAADGVPEVQETIISEDISEVTDVTVSEEAPEPKAKLFGLFRKSKGRKAAEGVPEVQESETAESIPEVQETILSEDISEVSDVTVSEEAPEPKAKLFGLFRKSKGRKAAEGIPEVQDSEAAESIPEVQETIAAETIPEELPEAEKPVLLIKKKPWSLAKKIIVPIASVFILALLTGGLFVADLFINPLGLVVDASKQTNAPMPTVLPPQPSESDSEESAGPSPTLDPYDILKAQADFSNLKGIVNVLLIGVDHGEERDAGAWSGKHAWHSDVMIVVSINTNTNKVSLISLPRDTYAKIPGVDGIYKLNASINCGGGWPKPEAFQKVCDAASWMIGGIPIQYYYAVDFNAVKDLVDAIGGVENFNVDITFKINGRSYKKGVQNMNGQAALDYMRVRKDAYIAGSEDDGDLNRINRQKAMLVAIFDKLKSTGNISAIPDILGAFEGNLYTNAKLPDTAAFAAYAYKNIDPKSISVYSMGGKYAYKLFDFNFVITDLAHRVKIIKNVYGIDISKDKQYKDVYSQYKKYSADRAWDLWYDMQTDVALKKSKKYLDQIKKKLDEDAAAASVSSMGGAALAEPDSTESSDPTDPPPTEKPIDTPTEKPTDTPTDPSGPTDSPTTKPSGGGKYSDDIRALYQTAKDEYNKLDKMNGGDRDVRGALIAKYKADVQKLCTVVLSFKWNASKWESYWQVVYNAKSKGSCNQHIVRNDIYVDFR